MCLGDEYDDINAISELAPLIAPILNVTAEGDLLVVYFTDILHTFPIHAALIENYNEQKAPNEHRVLVERNPIFYTFKHNYTSPMRLEALQSGWNGPKAHAAVLGVYEKTDHGGSLDPAAIGRREV
jgi:hypothetical protein